MNHQTDHIEISETSLQPNLKQSEEQANIGQSNNAFDNIVLKNSNAAYSGELFQNAAMFNQQAACASNLKQNQFVQVTSHGSIGLMNDPTVQQSELVSKNAHKVMTVNTNTTPVLTNPITDVHSVQLISLSNANTSGEGFPLHLENTVPISIVPQQIMNDAVHVTTNETEGAVTYLITMSVDDPDCQKTTNLNTLNEVIPLEEPQPQRTSTSTPKMNEDEMGNLNETIIAGNLNSEVQVPVQEKNSVEAEENITQEKVTDENGQTSTEEKKPAATTSKKPVGHRQFKLLEIDNIPVPEQKNEKVHNTTYCKEWVGKMNDPMNVSLAQSDNPVEKTSMDFSSLDITSISNNKPEYEKQEKFVSQRHKRPTTQLPKPKPEIPKM